MPEFEPSDAELLDALNREPQLLAIVYDRHSARLVRYLQRVGASEEIALDATQETFARLIIHRRRVRPADDGSLWPWLAVTGRNLVRDWQRRGSVEAHARRKLALPAAADESGASDSRLDAMRLGKQLRRALRRLSPEQRAAVTARVVDEFDYPQIASAMGASEQTVRRRVSRGLKAMQAFLEGGNS